MAASLHSIYVYAAYLHNCGTLLLKSSTLWIFPAAEATKEICWAGLA